jgi:hypothetical protein
MKENMIIKYLITLALLVGSSFVIAGPGDGTLPVIRSVQVKFIDGNFNSLPGCVNISVNRSLALGERFTKVLSFRKIDLKQQIVLENKAGSLNLKVVSKSILSLNKLSGLKKKVSRNEHLNELKLNTGQVTQIIQINDHSMQFESFENCIAR